MMMGKRNFFCNGGSWGVCVVIAIAKPLNSNLVVNAMKMIHYFVVLLGLLKDTKLFSPLKNKYMVKKKK